MSHARPRPRAFSVVIVAANVGWFGGLIRLFGEVTARLLVAVAPSPDDQRVLVVLGLTLATVGAVVAFLWRWSWYRNTLRQIRRDIRSLWGLPPKAEEPTYWSARMSGTSVVVVLVPALLLAALLPGLLAAAIALVVSVVVRVIGVAGAAAVDGPRPPSSSDIHAR